MSNNSMGSPVSLVEFLAEADLSHLHGAIRKVGVERVDQLKLVGDSEWRRMGMLTIEQRRLKKFLDKYYPQSYLGKFVKILHSKSNSSASISAPSNPSSRRNSGIDQLSDGTNNKWKDRGHPNSNVSSSPDGIIPINSIALQEVISKGVSTSVHRALWKHSNITTEVAVKKHQREWHQSEHDFIADVAELRSIDHRCLVKFFGVVLENESIVWSVTEIATNRSLLECLRDPLLKSSLPILVLCDMAHQICDGMKYLEQHGFSHGNLGARNVLVFRELRVKVGDVCFPHGELPSGDVNKRNAWLAPECYAGRNRSSQADVWAFGVTLWEMFSFGAQPFAGFTEAQIEEVVCEPYFRRLDQPDWCPRDYYDLMVKCWSDEKLDRPTFHYMLTALSDCKPEQLQVVAEDIPTNASLDRKILQCNIGDVIVVLDNDPHDGLGLWKGVVENRKAGLFDPSNTVTYLGADLIPSATNMGDGRLSNVRSSLKSIGKHKLNRNLISRPQNDFRHVGHVGLDGAHFGDVSLITNGNGLGSLSSLSRPSSRTPLSESRISSASSLATPESGSSRSTPEQQKVQRNGFSSSLGPIGIRKNNTNKPDLRISAPKGSSLSRVENVVDSGSSSRLALNIPEQCNFRLDMGPSLMDEVFRVFDSSSSFSSTKPAVASTNCSSEVVSDRMPLTLNCSEPSTPSDPISPNQHLRSDILDTFAQNESKQTSAQKMPPPAKPTAPPRKKAATPLSLGIKPVTARDEKVLENFINVSNQIAAKRDSVSIDKNLSSPALGSETNLKSRFSFRGFRSKIVNNDSLPPPSPRLTADRIISKPVELTDLITDDSKEAYRALVEECPRNQSDICQPSTPVSVISDQDELDNDESSPLKLFRRGAGSGMVYKANGNRPGRPVGGFARSVSHDPNSTDAVKLSVQPNNPLSVSRSFRESTNNDESAHDPVQLENTNGKKPERPNLPPPLPPRDRTKPLLQINPKPRERKYPLVIPSDEKNVEANSPQETSPEPGLVSEIKLKSPVKRDAPGIPRQMKGTLAGDGSASGVQWHDWKNQERECSF